MGSHAPRLIFCFSTQFNDVSHNAGDLLDVHEIYKHTVLPSHNFSLWVQEDGSDFASSLTIN
jgi:hypothetical protein